MSRLNRGRSAPEEKPKPKSALKRGKAAYVQAEEEQRLAKERANAPRMPWAFRADVGEDNPIIILDDRLEDAVFMHRHEIQDAQGKWGRQAEICTHESGYCPLCNLKEGGAKHIGHRQYVMVLSCLDLRGYTNKDGVEVTHSKRILMFKGSQVNEMLKMLEGIDEETDKKGNPLGIRGVYLNMNRANKKEGSSGKPGMVKDAKGKLTLYDRVPEEELQDEYSNKAVKDKETGRVLKPAGDDIEPFDYDKLFITPDPDALAKKYKGIGNAGGQEDINGDWDADSAPRRGRRSRQVEDDDAEDEEDTKPSGRLAKRKPAKVQEEEADDEDEAEEDDTEDADEDEKPARGKARTARGRAAAKEEDEEETEDDADDSDEEAEEPAGRGRKARVTSRRGAKAEEADDAEEDEEDDSEAEDDAEDEDDETPAPPPRTRAPRGKKAAKEEEADDEEDEEEKPAPRGRAAARKAAASKGKGKPF